uniref:Uncharacterized protein n=1 Tax=Tanacetum cinerariifolium TaxID=118510 RepID=A0A699JIJ0_TANCI|nr:hypothetical protein [Tanacetum cinerariifolium]
MATKATVEKSDVQNKQHMSDEAASSKYTMSNAWLETKIEIIPDICATKTAIEKNDVSAGVSWTKLDLFLDQLRLDVTGTIIIMIG